MAEVRRFSRSARTVLEPQPLTRPQGAAAVENFKTIRAGFDKGIEFLRPAVTLEQTAKGEREALEAVDEGSFEMRSPFSISDAAFNKTGERVVTNRAMIELDEEMNAALKKANGNIRVLDQELDRIKGEVGGQIPEIPGLKTRWLESYDRSVVTARRQTTELARRRAVAAQRRAAAQAAARVESEVERLALTSATPDELTEALLAGQDSIAEFGPRGEFELNGKTYPADPSRAAMYSPEQMRKLQAANEAKAHDIFLEADFLRSDAPAQWADEFKEQVLSGNSPLPPAKALAFVNKMESRARATENARRAEENRIAKAQAEAAEAGLSPYVTAQENGLMVAIPDETRAELLDLAEGNPNLTQDLEASFVASDLIVDMAGMTPPEQISYIEGLQQQFIDTPGITPQEAEAINQLAPHLKAAKAAITKETVGVSAAEQILSSGGTLDDEQIGQLRVAAAGNPKVQQSVEVIVEAQRMIEAGQKLTGTQREEWIKKLDAELAELALEGDRVGASAQLRLKASEQALKHFKTMETAAQEDPARFAELNGIALPPLVTDEDQSLGAVAASIAERIAILAPRTGQFGNDTPVPLSQSEREFLIDFMRDSNNAGRVDFLEKISRLPTAKGDAVLEALGIDNPALLGAARVRGSNPSSSRTILSGMSATITGATITARAEAEIPLASVLQTNTFPEPELDRIRATAEAYAKGAAMRKGETEILPEDLEKGYDIALGADENGAGGIEVVDGGRAWGFNYGTTVLPTGVKGADVALRLDNIRDDQDLEAFAGGIVQDGLGNPVTARQMKRSIAGFRIFAQPDGPSLLIPVTELGEMFIRVDQDGNAAPFAFDPRGD